MPVFVYGLLKRGELGHGQVADFLIGEKPIVDVDVAGFELLILDGIAYAVSADDKKIVRGQLLKVRPEAYDSIIKFENYGAPEPKYVWAEIKGDFGSANILVSTVSNFRSRHQRSDHWSILDDKFYVEGIPWVRAQIRTLKLEAADSPEAKFLALAAFWITAVTFERTLKFCFGIPPLGHGSGIRSGINKNVLADPNWIAAFERLVGSRNLSPQTDEMQLFFQDWNDLRNKIKGKPEAFLALDIASKTEAMLNFLEHLLRKQSPKLAEAWSRQSRVPRDPDIAWKSPSIPSGFNFVDGGLAWCGGKLSEFRNRYESFKGYAEGDASVSLQSTFLVAWTIFEALLKSNYPNFVNTGGAISDQLRGDPRWAEAIEKQGPLRVSWVWSQFNPLQKPPTDHFCFSAWQELRNNVIHRGKSAIPEFKLVLEATEQIVHILEQYSNLLGATEKHAKEHEKCRT